MEVRRSQRIREERERTSEDKGGKRTTPEDKGGKRKYTRRIYLYKSKYKKVGVLPIRIV